MAVEPSPSPIGRTAQWSAVSSPPSIATVLTLGQIRPTKHMTKYTHPPEAPPPNRLPWRRTGRRNVSDTTVELREPLLGVVLTDGGFHSITPISPSEATPASHRKTAACNDSSCFASSRCTSPIPVTARQHRLARQHHVPTLFGADPMQAAAAVAAPPSAAVAAPPSAPPHTSSSVWR